MIARSTVVLLLALAWTMTGPRAAEPDARLAEATQLLHQGDQSAAERLWREVVADAMAPKDAEALDAARRGLAGLAFQNGDYDAFTELQRQRLAEADARGDLRVQADARLELALLDRRRGRLDEARVALDDVIQRFRAAKDAGGEGRALTHLGLVLLNLGQYAQALDALDAAQALHRAGADIEVDRTYHYLGLLNRSLQDNAQALHFLGQALDEARRHPDPMRAAPVLGSLARVSNDSGDFAAALRYTDESLEMARRSDSAPGEAYSLLERGRALLGIGRLEAAREALDATRRLSLEISQERTAADATFALGRVARADGDLASALGHFRKALVHYEAAGDAPQTYDAYRQMIPLLRAQGEHAEAARLAEAALDLEQQVAGRDAARRSALAQHRQEIERKAHEIELLQRENEISELRLANERLDRRIGTSVSAGLALLAALLAWAVLRGRRIRRALALANRELEAGRGALAQANAALAERAQVLAQAAATDALTGLSNRAHVLDGLENAAARAHSRSQSLAVLMLDVDRFKAINDTQGHRTGDQVLRSVAGLMRALVPPKAMLGRYGGEEFLMVLPGHDLEDARRIAESLRHAVEEHREAGIPPVTVSIGVAVRRAGSDIDPDHLVEEADQALYRAKQAGRNRVEASLRVA